MALYHLKAKEGREEWKPWYDKCFGFVVRANSEEEARQVAANHSSDEGPHAWTNADASTCHILPIEGEKEVIIDDVRLA